MKIKFVKSPSGAPYFLGYFIGDEAEIEDAVAKDLIEQKVAVLAAEKPSDKAEKAISKAATGVEKR